MTFCGCQGAEYNDDDDNSLEDKKVRRKSSLGSFFSMSPAIISAPATDQEIERIATRTSQQENDDGQAAADEDGAAAAEEAPRRGKRDTVVVESPRRAESLDYTEIIVRGCFCARVVSLPGPFSKSCHVAFAALA